jgi:hypothetical protein
MQEMCGWCWHASKMLSIPTTHRRGRQRQGDSSWRPERSSTGLHSALPAGPGPRQCPERQSENVLLPIYHLLFYFEPHASESQRLETQVYRPRKLIRAHLLLQVKPLLLHSQLPAQPGS